MKAVLPREFTKRKTHRYRANFAHKKKEPTYSASRSNRMACIVESCWETRVSKSTLSSPHKLKQETSASHKESSSIAKHSRSKQAKSQDKAQDTSTLSDINTHTDEHTSPQWPGGHRADPLWPVNACRNDRRPRWQFLHLNSLIGGQERLSMLRVSTRSEMSSVNSFGVPELCQKTQQRSHATSLRLSRTSMISWIGVLHCRAVSWITQGRKNDISDFIGVGCSEISNNMKRWPEVKWTKKGFWLELCWIEEKIKGADLVDSTAFSDDLQSYSCRWSVSNQCNK